MRRLLIIFLLFSSFAYGQTTQTIGNKTTLVVAPYGIRVDSVFHNAVRDTIFRPSRLGIQVYRQQDRSLYISIDTLQRPYWGRIGSGRDSISIRKDSIFVYTRDTVYYVGNMVIDSTVYATTSSVHRDSLLLSNRINGKVDSVTFNRNANVDTVKYWVNGTSYVSGYIPRKDGLISGGVVTWISGLTFEVSAAIYSINGTLYSSPTTQLTLNTADPTNPRIDVIALNTSNAAVKITGTAAANPAEPQVDPASQLALTSIYIPAAASVPQGVSQTVVYDENTEWTTATTSGITANFNSTTTAKNGTKSIAVSNFSSGGSLRFTNGTTVSRANYTAVKFWVNLTVALTTQDIYVQFFNGNRSASDQQRALFTKSSTGGWQSASLNLSQFTFTNQNFDRIQLTFAGSSSSTLYADYIVLQGGITQSGGTGEVDPYSVHITDSSAMLSPYLRKADTTNKWVTNATLSASGDSLVVYKNGVRTASKIASGGTGGTLTNIGTGVSIGVNGTSNVKKVAGINGVQIDSTTTASTVTFQVDSLRYSTKAYTQYKIDSLMAAGQEIDSTLWSTKANVTKAKDSVVSLIGTTSKQTQTAAGSSSFTFTGVPASYDDYLVFRNGFALRPTDDYSTAGNVITITGLDVGDKITFQRLK